MASSKKWARFISSIASITYILIIFLQVPLFRIPCRSGICTTPIQMTSSQLIASELIPPVVVEALLYPGAAAAAVLNNQRIPHRTDMLKLYDFTDIKDIPAWIDLQRLEVLAGCYFMVAGAILGLIKPVRMSIFGTLMVIWGIGRETILRKIAQTESLARICCYSTLFVALVSAFCSMRRDMRKIIRFCKEQQADNHRRIFTKEKYI